MARLLVEPPRRIPLWLRPALWLAARITGKDPLPARLLVHAPKQAVGFGVFELMSAHAPRDLDARTLAAARIVASVVAGCPFCIDMNAATWRTAGLTPDELAALFADAARVTDDAGARRDSRLPCFSSFDARVMIAARYASALSSTPVHVDEELARMVRETFSPREVVVLASTIAQVNTWARFNHGLGVPAAGFFDDTQCSVPLPAAKG